MNESSSVRRALTFLVPTLLIAWLTWYLLHGPQGDSAASAVSLAEPPTRIDPNYPPAWPHQGAVSTSGSEQVELCGHGPVPVDAIPADLELAADAAVLRRAESLQRSVVPNDRMLGYATATVVAWSQVYVRAHQLDPNCSSRAGCGEKANLDSARAAVPAAEGLARLAVTSRDPSIYASALAACRLAAPAPEINACSSLRAEQWAQLDPENAYAWFEVARVSAQRKDTRAVDEAMQRAVRGRTLQFPLPPFADLLAGQSPPVDAVDALTVARVLDVYVRWLTPVAEPTVLQNYCTRETMADAARKGLCGELATVLTERDGSLLGMLIGINIGGSAGWSAERVATLRSRLRAMSDALARDQPGRDLLTCDGAARGRSWLADVQKGGEAAHARRVLAGTDSAQARR